jgi:hypothetical protein
MLKGVPTCTVIARALRIGSNCLIMADSSLMHRSITAR